MPGVNAGTALKSVVTVAEHVVAERDVGGALLRLLLLLFVGETLNA